MDVQVVVPLRALLDLIEVARIGADELRQSRTAPGLADAITGAAASVEAQVLSPV